MRASYNLAMPDIVHPPAIKSHRAGVTRRGQQCGVRAMRRAPRQPEPADRLWQEGRLRQPLTERYRERLAGVLSCYDRIIVTGTLPGACYAKGMTGFLSARQIRVFDYPRFAEPLRDQVRERAAELASAAGITIEHIAKNHIRKEDVVARVLVVRGDRPGLVHIISAMEACDTYKPWHDKHTHRTFLRPDTGKCLHYYFYFIYAELGLIYLRVPTWCPFRLQFYCNGHSWLARQLTAAGIGFELADNAFVRIDDGQRAQTLADPLSPAALHQVLDRYAKQCCPVFDVFAPSYHWSFMQATGASCRSSTPPIWCSARKPSSNRSMNSFPGRPS